MLFCIYILLLLTLGFTRGLPYPKPHRKQNLQCICFMQRGDITLSLPCGHGFHSSCLLPWLVQKATCPFCKGNISESFYLENNITFPAETSPSPPFAMAEILRRIQGFPSAAIYSMRNGTTVNDRELLTSIWVSAERSLHNARVGETQPRPSPLMSFLRTAESHRDTK